MPTKKETNHAGCACGKLYGMCKCGHDDDPLRQTIPTTTTTVTEWLMGHPDSDIADSITKHARMVQEMWYNSISQETRKLPGGSYDK